jgi:hypothetical protein
MPSGTWGSSQCTSWLAERRGPEVKCQLSGLRAVGCTQTKRQGRFDVRPRRGRLETSLGWTRRSGGRRDWPAVENPSKNAPYLRALRATPASGGFAVSFAVFGRVPYVHPGPRPSSRFRMPVTQEHGAGCSRRGSSRGRSLEMARALSAEAGQAHEKRPTAHCDVMQLALLPSHFTSLVLFSLSDGTVLVTTCPASALNYLWKLRSSTLQDSYRQGTRRRH